MTDDEIKRENRRLECVVRSVWPVVGNERVETARRAMACAVMALAASQGEAIGLLRGAAAGAKANGVLREEASAEAVVPDARRHFEVCGCEDCLGWRFE